MKVLAFLVVPVLFGVIALAVQTSMGLEMSEWKWWAVGCPFWIMAGAINAEIF